MVDAFASHLMVRRRAAPLNHEAEAEGAVISLRDQSADKRPAFPEPLRPESELGRTALSAARRVALKPGMASKATRPDCVAANAPQDEVDVSKVPLPRHNPHPPRDRAHLARAGKPHRD